MSVVTVSDEQDRDKFFDNFKGWMRPQEVAEAFGISILTIYSWKAKAKTRKIPEGLFINPNQRIISFRFL